MKKIAVVLSGCGVYDGSEIYESTLTLLALDKANAQAICTAPNIDQFHTINHITGETQPDQRNVLEESARLARGQITPLDQLNIDEIDAAIFPGGFGAAKNSCNFASTDADYQINPQVADFIKALHKQGKWLGFLCIAPVIAANLFANQNIQITIGNDPETAQRLEALGAKHINCSVDEIAIDQNLKIVSTPAYMLAQRIKELEPGIQKVVDTILNS